MNPQTAPASALYLHIPQLINAERQIYMDRLIAQSNFSDGKATATNAARDVKNNLQIGIGDQNTLPLLQQQIVEALNQSPLFNSAALPKNVYPPLISRYEQGMNYGWHVDSPIMGSYTNMRIDIAMTIFLSDPDSYDGGELAILSPTGEIHYKLAKGDAIIYPCTQVHCVREVTKGVRQVAVTWIQSMVPDPAKRKILFDLQQVYGGMSQNNPNSPEANLLLQTHSNLVRMWAEL